MLLNVRLLKLSYPSTISTSKSVSITLMVLNIRVFILLHFNYGCLTFFTFNNGVCMKKSPSNFEKTFLSIKHYLTISFPHRIHLPEEISTLCCSLILHFKIFLKNSITLSSPFTRHFSCHIQLTLDC
jgi:hypothetical protein